MSSSATEIPEAPEKIRYLIETLTGDEQVDAVGFEVEGGDLIFYDEGVVFAVSKGHWRTVATIYPDDPRFIKE